MIIKILKHLFYSVKTNSKIALGVAVKPRLVEFEITNLCNSKCVHCSKWQSKYDKNTLTLKEIYDAFRDPFMRDVESILLTGGEPTLRRDLLEIIQVLHRCCPKARIQLSTNGILAERVFSIVKKALADGIKMDVGISLDGVGKSHDEVRGVPGNFEKVDWLVRQLLKLKKEDNLYLCLGMTVSDLTVDNYSEMKAYCKSLGVDMEYAWYQTSPFYDNKEVVRKGKTRQIVEGMPDTPRKQAWLKDLNGEPIRFRCYALDNFFVLNHDGGVSPCLTYTDRVVGNIKEQSFKEILTGLKCKETKRDVVRPCGGCLNSWAFSVSQLTRFLPYFWHYLRHPKGLWGRK